MKAYLLVLAALLVGCGADESTITFPKSACLTAPTGQIRHQHRNAYTTFISVQNQQEQPVTLAYAHSSSHSTPHSYYHPSRPRRLIPVFHAARDWDEEQVSTTCVNSEWHEKVTK